DAVRESAETVAIGCERRQPLSIQLLLAPQLDDVLRVPLIDQRVTVGRLRSDAYSFGRYDVISAFRVSEQQMARRVEELEGPRRPSAQAIDRLPPILARRQRDGGVEQRALVLPHTHARVLQIVRDVDAERQARAAVDDLPNENPVHPPA